MLRPWARPGSPRAPPLYLHIAGIRPRSCSSPVTKGSAPASSPIARSTAGTSTSIPRPSRRTRASTSSTTRFERGAIEIGAAAVRQRPRAGGVDDGRRRLHRDHDVHGAALPEPRRPADQYARAQAVRAARARGRHRLRERDGGAPAGAQSPARVPGPPRGGGGRRALLDGVLRRRPPGERGGPRHLRRRRRRARPRLRRRRAGDRRAPDHLPAGASVRHGLRVSRAAGRAWCSRRRSAASAPR